MVASARTTPSSNQELGLDSERRTQTRIQVVGHDLFFFTLRLLRGLRILSTWEYGHQRESIAYSNPLAIQALVPQAVLVVLEVRTIILAVDSSEEDLLAASEALEVRRQYFDALESSSGLDSQLPQSRDPYIYAPISFKSSGHHALSYSLEIPPSSNHGTRCCPGGRP